MVCAESWLRFSQLRKETAATIDWHEGNFMQVAMNEHAGKCIPLDTMLPLDPRQEHCTALVVGPLRLPAASSAEYEKGLVDFMKCFSGLDTPKLPMIVLQWSGPPMDLVEAPMKDTTCARNVARYNKVHGLCFIC